jgi:nucleoside-diphosphate-sugar epimerase
MPGKWTTVTGATGFVGSQILRSLLDNGRSVRVLYRDPAHVDGLREEPSLELVHTPDLFTESRERLIELLDDSDTLVHAAWYAEPGEYLTSPLNLTCLTGTLNMANAFSRIGGKRFVGLGSCAEYDTSSGVIPTDTPLAPSTLYAACKVSAFQVLQHFLQAESISFAWCRLFYLYGEGEHERRLVPYIRKQIEADEEVLLTRGEQVRDFLDVKDAAKMIADVVMGDQEGPVNICSGEGVTVRQLAESIADKYGRRDLLRFGARPDSLFDPPKIVGAP